MKQQKLVFCATCAHRAKYNDLTSNMQQVFKQIGPLCVATAQIIPGFYHDAMDVKGIGRCITKNSNNRCKLYLRRTLFNAMKHRKLLLLMALMEKEGSDGKATDSYSRYEEQRQLAEIKKSSSKKSSRRVERDHRSRMERSNDSTEAGARDQEDSIERASVVLRRASDFAKSNHDTGDSGVSDTDGFVDDLDSEERKRGGLPVSEAVGGSDGSSDDAIRIDTVAEQEEEQ